MSLAFNGDFALDSGATVTVAGKGETTINNLTTLGSSSTAISKTDTGVLTFTGSNIAYNTTITASVGTLQIAQSSVQGSTTTVVGVAATLSGGGICGTVINHGTIAPSTSAAAIFTLSISGSLTCPLDTNNPSYVTSLLGGAPASQYIGLLLQGASDFSGSYLQIGSVNGFLPAINTAFTLGTVQGSTNAPAKAFRSLPEGALFRIGRYVFSITYQGGSNAKNIVVTRVPTPAPATGLSSRTAQSTVSLPITGFSGEVVQVESSPDLQSWSVVQTLTLDSTGAATFAQTSSSARAFFRVRAVDP